MAVTVRDAVLDDLRERGLTTLFANPGSTEVPFLAGLPSDFDFVLGLHEGAVVGMASGFAIGRDEPAVAILHATAGLGNAVGALATARVNRAPLVVVVGQQDRRHLALEPFLAGRLVGLAGDNPVWVDQPLRPQDVPGAIARASHEAVTGRGPALVVVPMDDWHAEVDPETEPVAAAGRILRAAVADRAAVQELGAFLAGARRPAIVVGARADDARTWSALVALAERLGAAVWQESFGARAGFPQDHRLFAGHLPADRVRLRQALDGYDAVLVVGGPVLRQYPYAPGRLVPEGARVALVTDDPAEAHRSPAELVLLAPPAPVCEELVELVSAAGDATAGVDEAPTTPVPPAEGEPLHAGHVFAELARRLPADAILVEETPSSRPELHRRIPARAPLGFLSAAMGGLGFAFPASIGLRMALPERPVVAVVGDGSSLYTIQALWSAGYYGVGALFVVLSNRGYAVMDRLAEREGGAAPWPAIDVDVSAIATGLGCPALRISGRDELAGVLDDVVPGLAGRSEPLLLEVPVAQDEVFAP